MKILSGRRRRARARHHPQAEAKPRRAPKFCAPPGNGGIAADARVRARGSHRCGRHGGLGHARKHVDYVVVAPDDPLALGMVDALAEAGIPAFGPDKAAARIEASKVFCQKPDEKIRHPHRRL